MTRFIFPKPYALLWLLLAAILFIAAVALAYPGKIGLTREAPLGQIRKGNGFLLSAPFPPEMKKSYGRVFLPQDEVVVLEDGVALPVLAPGKKDIELAGWGRFRLGTGEVFFSSSDGKNFAGRNYSLRWPAWSVRELLPGLLFLASLTALGIGSAPFQASVLRHSTILGISIATLLAIGMLLFPARVAEGFYQGGALPLAWSLAVALLANGGRVGGIILPLAGALLPALIGHYYFGVMGASHPWFLVGGILPLSDANMHFTQAVEILRQGEVTTGFNGRFLYPLFLSALMSVTGENAQLVQFFSTVIVLGSLSLMARSVCSHTGVFGTATVLFLVWLYFRLNGAWLSMTENLGLPLGLLATGFFVIGAREKHFAICVAGLFLFSVGMATRPGAMFVLPALAVFCVLKFGGGIGNLRRSALASLAAGIAMLAGLGTNSLASAFVYKGASPAYQNFAFSLNGLLTGSHWSESHDGGRGDPAEVMEENKRLLRENPSLVLTGSLRTLEYLWPRGFFFRFDKDSRFVGLSSLLALAGFATLALQCSMACQRGWMFAALTGILLSLPFAPPWDAGSRPYAVTMPIVFLLCGLGAAGISALCQKAAKAVGFSQNTPEPSPATSQATITLLAAATGIMLLTATPLFGTKPRSLEPDRRLTRPGGILHVGNIQAVPKSDFLARLSVLGMNYPDLQREFIRTTENFMLAVDWNGPTFRVVDLSSGLQNPPGEEIYSVVFDSSILSSTTSD